jgi:hypothetical protein
MLYMHHFIAMHPYTSEVSFCSTLFYISLAILLIAKPPSVLASIKSYVSMISHVKPPP